MKTFFQCIDDQIKNGVYSEISRLVKTDEDIAEVSTVINNFFDEILSSEPDAAKRMQLLNIQEAGFWNAAGNTVGNMMTGTQNAFSNFAQGYQQATQPRVQAQLVQPGQQPGQQQPPNLLTPGQYGKSAFQIELEALGTKLNRENPVAGKIFSNAIGGLVRKMQTLQRPQQQAQGGQWQDWV